MKKLSIILGLILLPLFGYGQQTEIALSYGLPSLYGVTESIVGDIGRAVLGYGSSTTSNGVLSLAVKGYNTDRKWRYGGVVDIETFSTDGAIQSDTYYSLSPVVDYFWSSAEHKFRIYSGISAGAIWRVAKYIDAEDMKETESDVILAVNLTPVGFRYGEDFGIFLDTNIGSRGFLQLGVSYDF